MRVVIEGVDLPGRTFCDPDGRRLDDVCVGIQVGQEPCELVRGDAIAAHWDLDVRVVLGSDESVDFRGPAVHGKRGDRFLYLTWGNVNNHGIFEMFRRAKLMLNHIDLELVSSAEREQRPLVGTVRLREAHGGPRCARVDPPDLVWTLG